MSEQLSDSVPRGSRNGARKTTGNRLREVTWNRGVGLGPLSRAQQARGRPGCLEHPPAGKRPLPEMGVALVVSGCVQPLHALYRSRADQRVARVDKSVDHVPPPASSGIPIWVSRLPASIHPLASLYCRVIDGRHARLRATIRSQTIFRLFSIHYA